LTAENLSPLFHLPIERVTVRCEDDQIEALVPVFYSQRGRNRE